MSYDVISLILLLYQLKNSYFISHHYGGVHVVPGGEHLFLHLQFGRILTVLDKKREKVILPCFSYGLIEMTLCCDKSKVCCDVRNGIKAVKHGVYDTSCSKVVRFFRNFRTST